jgi:ATP phosphoribosyltransferase
MLKLALPKGRLSEAVFSLLGQCGYLFNQSTSSRQLVVEDDINQFTYYFVKPSDVVTYVEEGVCDIGVVGSDTLDEQTSDVYELLDLKIGVCKMVVAGKNDMPINKIKRIATKYPRIAKSYFNQLNQSVSIVKLNGSVELGPLVGLSDAIVDIYETGSTLRANGLDVLDDVMPISSRLIVNKESYRRLALPIQSLLEKLEEVI